MKIKKVLVSQPKPTSEKSPYYDIAEKYGVKIDFRPFIKVESLSAKEFRQQKVSILDHTAVIFTSRHAIDHFFNLCAELRVTVPETMKYFCTSETIALYVCNYQPAYSPVPSAASHSHSTAAAVERYKDCTVGLSAERCGNTGAS